MPSIRRKILQSAVLWSIAGLLIVSSGVLLTDLRAADRRIERGSAPIDAVASRKISVAREFIAARQWAGAIDLIGELTGTDGDVLVRLDADRAVPGRIAARILLGSLPPEGLDVYRKRVDPLAKPRFDAASRDWDEAALVALVEELFGSSVTDAALWQLGEIAFERGDLAAAKSWWSLLIPMDARRTALAAGKRDAPAEVRDREDVRNDAPPAPEGQAEPPPVEAGPPEAAPGTNTGATFVLAPTSRWPIADVRARLILCTIHLGEWSQARREIRAFNELHPEATGRLAGQTVRWGQWLSDELAAAIANTKAARGSSEPPPDRPAAPEVSIDSRTFASFAGSANRSGEGPPVPDFGGVAWSSPWTRAYSHDSGEGPFSISGIPLAPYHAVVAEGCVFACDEKAIYGWKLASGEPIWAPAKTPALFTLVGDGQGVTTHPYAMVGSPAFTVTIAQGRLFARLGAITMGRPTQPVPASSIVCLNVAEGQGRVEWVVEARDLAAEPGDWMFEGTPVVSDNLVIAGVRLGGSKPRAGLVCLSAATGQQVWFREVATAGPSWQSDESSRLIEVSHELIAVAEGTVYYNTHLGIVAALDLETGEWQWSWSYPRVIAATPGEHSGRRRFGPSPPVVVHGRVFLAPSDALDLYALDAVSGMPLWRFPSGSRFRTVLGADGDRVYVAGRDLAAVDADTGKLLWQRRSSEEAEEPAFARGCLAPDAILWPTRDELKVVRRDTGEVTRVLRFRDRGIDSGGNVLIAGDMTLVASPRQLYALRQEPVPVEKPVQTTLSQPPHKVSTARAVSQIPPPSQSPRLTGRILTVSLEQTSSDAGVTPPDRSVAPSLSNFSPRHLKTAWTIERDEDLRVRVLSRPDTDSERPSDSGEAILLLSGDIQRIDPLSGKSLWRKVFIGRNHDLSTTDNVWVLRSSREVARIDPATGNILEHLPARLVGNIEGGADSGTQSPPVPGRRIHTWTSIGSTDRLEEWQYPNRLREPANSPSPDRPAREWTIPAGERIVDATWLGPNTWGVVSAEIEAWLLTPASPIPRNYTGALSYGRGHPFWLGGLIPADRALLISDGTTLTGVEISSGKQAWSLSLGQGPALTRDQLLFVPLSTTDFTPGAHPSESPVSPQTATANRSQPARSTADVVAPDALLLAVSQGVVAGYLASSGQPLFRRVLGPADSDWRFVAPPTAHSHSQTPIVLQRRDGELAQFWRIEAQTGRPVQWIEVPWDPRRIEWVSTDTGALLVGPRHVTGLISE